MRETGLRRLKFEEMVQEKKKKKMAMVKVMVGSVTEDSDNLKDDEIVANEMMTVTIMSTLIIIMITA